MFLIFINFLSDEIFWPAGPIFGSGGVVSQNLIPIGPQVTLKDLLACWGAIARPLKIRKSNLESFGLMLAFLAFMALRLKSLQSAEFLCQNGPHKAKKLQNFNKCSCGLVCGLWKKNLAFFIFLEVLDTYEVQWYTKIMYVSSISPLTKTKPKFPFRHIVYM